MLEESNKSNYLLLWWQATKLILSISLRILRRLPMCYGLNVPPILHHIEILIPAIPECDYIWIYEL